jgi:hypothetical protein
LNIITFFAGGMLLASQKPGGGVVPEVWFVPPHPLRKITVQRSAAIEPLDREVVKMFSKRNCSTPEPSEGAPVVHV